MSVNCQHIVPCPDVSHYVELLLIPQGLGNFLFHKMTVYFYRLLPVFDPIICSCKIFLLLLHLCFFKVINFNFRTIFRMHLMTTIQTHTFMAGEKGKKKCLSFLFLKTKNPRTPPPTPPKPDTLKTRVLYMCLLKVSLC